MAAALETSVQAALFTLHPGLRFDPKLSVTHHKLDLDEGAGGPCERVCMMWVCVI